MKNHKPNFTFSPRKCSISGGGTEETKSEVDWAVDSDWWVSSADSSSEKGWVVACGERVGMAGHGAGGARGVVDVEGRGLRCVFSR